MTHLLKYKELLTDYDRQLAKYEGMIRHCLEFIYSGSVKGIVTYQLNELIHTNLRRMINKSCSRDQIHHELNTVFYIIWHRYKPDKGDFHPYLMASFAFEVYKRFKRLEVWEYKETSLEAYNRRKNPSKRRHYWETRQMEMTQIPDTRVSSQQWTNLDNWTFNLPGIEKLSLRDEEMLRLRFMQGLRIADIAAMMGVSSKTVGRNCLRIKKYLLESLS